MGFSLTNLFGGKKARAAGSARSARHRAVRARFDALTRTDNNRRQRAALEYQSANAELTPEVRREMRALARYERANNSYCNGIVSTLANDCIGRGPRLQLIGENSATNQLLEAEFMQWAKAIDLAGKLRTMRMAKAVDGEAFAMLTTNEAIPHPVMLDVQLVEADRIASPWRKSLAGLADDRAVDGIEYDEWNNPVAYELLSVHPGPSIGADTAKRIPASAMMHLFRVDRPGQSRGISELMPALPLFEQLRRYTLAVLAAAEVAADWAGVLYTDAPADGADQADAFEGIELESRMLMTMPAGWRMEQTKAEQPVTSYGDFVARLLNEILRCLNMPFNVGTGNSSTYNYASGRLDHQTYFNAIAVERSIFECRVLDRVLHEWLREAAKTLGIVPASMRDRMHIPHQWYWDGHPHVDPVKDAKSQEIRLANGTTNLAIECAAEGRDWEEVQDQQLIELARKQKRMRELGIEPEPAFTRTGPGDDDEEDTDAA